jgi:hypothetical protein
MAKFRCDSFALYSDVDLPIFEFPSYKMESSGISEACTMHTQSFFGAWTCFSFQISPLIFDEGRTLRMN